MQFIVTNSMRSTFLDCPYKFFLEYVLRLTPKREASYFRWGSLVHAGTECMDHGEDPNDAIVAERQRAEKRCLPPDELEEVDGMCNLLPTVMDAYLLRWSEDDKHYEMLGGEERGGKFTLELPCGWLFKGKIDKMVRDVRTGKELNWERKTAASVNDQYFEDVLLDSQPKGYLLAAQRCFGINSQAVVYDMIGKPGIKHKKWQTREMFIQELGEKYLLDRMALFQRRRMPFDQKEIDAYYWEIDQVAQTIQWHLQEGIWPKHHPRNKIGGCAYKPICLHSDYSKFYTRDKNHLNPELSL